MSLKRDDGQVQRMKDSKFGVMFTPSRATLTITYVQSHECLYTARKQDKRNNHQDIKLNQLS